MTPRWCLLYRVTYPDGVVAECGTRSWAETETTETVSKWLASIMSNGASAEVVAVLPWADEHYTRTTEELFAEVGGAL